MIALALDRNENIKEYLNGPSIDIATNYEKTLVAQIKSNLLLRSQMYNMTSLQLIQLKMDN